MANNKMERFTQRARQVLTLAEEEAERFEHNYIGTEHMLLGLLREEGGVAGRALRDLGVELERARELVAELTRATPRKPDAMRELSSGTKRVLELAVDEARRMGHHYIGTEHLILGLVRHTDGVAIDVLKRLGVSPEEVRRQTRRVLQEAPAQKSEVPTDSPSTIAPSVRKRLPHSETFEVIQGVIEKILQMVAVNKITVEQGKELLSAVHPEINLTPGETAQLASNLIEPGAVEKRRLRLILTQGDQNTPIEFTVSLEIALRNIDALLGAVMQNRDTEIAFSDSEANIKIEVHIETKPAEASQ